MSGTEKLVQRLLSVPKDFTWEELSKVLSLFGYNELKKGKTGGSRRKFADEKKNVIILHKPHPGNIIKEYAIKQVITQLKEKGHLTK
jgi:HicA-like toxin of HicAB toxin-antitoxin system